MTKKTKLTIFEIISLTWITTSIFALFLAFLGIFHAILFPAFVILFLGIIYKLQKNKKITIVSHTKGDKVVLGIITIIAIILSLLTTPTIFGGRDEGSLTTSAIMISQSHGLKHKNELINQFSEIYKKGKALNFPGFYYPEKGTLKSQFLPAYSTWTAIYHSIYGINGLRFVNFFPFITFIFSFYLIAKQLIKTSNKKNQHTFTYIATGLLATSYPLITFYKFTLSEIYFAGLVWFAIYLLFKYLENRTQTNFTLFLAPLLIMPFARVESLAFIFIIALILIFMDYNNAKSQRYQAIFSILLISIILSITLNVQFFVETFRNFAQFSVPGIESNETTNKSFSFTNLIPNDWKDFYLLKIFYNYNLLYYIILMFTVVIGLLKKKHWKYLIPFFILSPTLIYLVNANISLDHPWMLRRYLFGLIPLGILYTTILLKSIHRKIIFFDVKKLVWVMVGCLFLLNLSLAIPTIAQSQNRPLMTQLSNIAGNFNDKDLVLISQKSTSNGFSLISEPLRTVFGKQAVYFFNPNDLKKIDRTKFEKVYLMISNEKEEQELFKNLEKKRVKDYEIINSTIAVSKDPLTQPTMHFYKTSGVIYELR